MAINMLTAAVAAETGLTRDAARAAVGAVLDAIAHELAAERAVSISNFGTFRPAKRSERAARNPFTGESMTVPECLVVHFRSSGRLREIVRDRDTTGTVKKLAKGAARNDG